jgi:hypothetical protein
MRLPSMFLLCSPFLFGHWSPRVSHAVVADFGLRVLDRRPLPASLCTLNPPGGEDALPAQFAVRGPGKLMPDQPNDAHGSLLRKVDN